MDKCPSSQSPQSKLQEKLINMFELAEKTTDLEQELEAQISAITNEFLLKSGFCSDIEVRSLTEKFRESKVPIEPINVYDYINDLVESVVTHSIRTSSPRFIGHMTSALPYFVRPLGKLMISMNQNMVKMETSKSLSLLERQVLAMIHRLIYQFSDEFYDCHIQRKQSTLGITVSGGTLANLTALWCMRNTALGPCNGFAGVESEGLSNALKFYGYDGAVVIGSALMHFSFEKAADILGIGVCNLIKVPVDSKNRIDIKLLEQTIATCRAQNLKILGLIGIAGTTDCGSIDPLTEMVKIACTAQIHFHVDASWGGPLLFSEQHRLKLAGIEQADSVAIDGHKQLYLPMGIGLLMLRNPHIASAIEKQARYVIRPNSIDLGKRSLEGSRPGMALFLHGAMNIIGWKGYEFLINEGIRKTLYMASSIRVRSEFELLLEPETNILIYRYIPERWRDLLAGQKLSVLDNQVLNQFNERLQKSQRQAGHSFVSRTTIDMVYCNQKVSLVALRAVFANPLTTEADMDAVLDEQIQLAKELDCGEKVRQGSE